MRHVSRIAALVLLACMVAPAIAASDAQRAAIQAEVDALKGRDFGCTRMRKLYRDLRIKYADYHFVFAGRKAATITGIRGCGFAFGASEPETEQRAMTACRRIERQLGTGPNRERTCRFME